MMRAIELAQNGVDQNHGGPFGCVVAKDGRIVGEGCNRVTSTNDPTAHAEIVAIRDACKNLTSFRLEGCTIYTSCEPCPMCLGAIYWSRPARMFFAATRGDAAAARLMELQDELQLAFAFISHDLRVVEHISHDMAVMFLGKVV